MHCTPAKFPNDKSNISPFRIQLFIRRANGYQLARANIRCYRDNNCPFRYSLRQASTVCRSHRDFCLTQRLVKREHVPLVVRFARKETIRASHNAATDSRRFLVQETGCCVVRPKASEFWLERVTLFRADLNYNRLTANSLSLSLSLSLCPGCTLEIQQTASWECLRFRSNEFARNC